MLLDDLNPSQREAVEYEAGPSLIVAGAGSGKTRVLTYKIAYLLSRGMEPWRVLALTFTNKAAKEMKERIGQLVGEERARFIQMGTFHSVFARILRQEATQIGYQPTFTIYDEADARSLVKRIIKERQLDEKIYKPVTVHKRISMAKDNLMTAADYAEDRYFLEHDEKASIPQVASIYADYEARCKQANAMDFDDLLMHTWRLFHEHPDVLQRYASRFQYILIDEYQDTNAAQQAVMLQLAQGCPRVCAVGDDYQSIYAFRGAKIDNILDFQHKFAGAKIFKLERNYRSTQLIVEAANSLMEKNSRQITKRVYSEGERGERISYQQAYSDKEEAAIVVNHIKSLYSKDCPHYSDFAILYRTHAQSRSFEDALRHEGIPYVIKGGLGFYQRKEIKDVLAYFRLVANPNDEEAFVRVVNYPKRGIGDTTVGAVLQAAHDNGVSVWDTIGNAKQYGVKAGTAAIKKLLGFVELIASFQVRAADTDAYELGKDIIKLSGISADLYSCNDPEYLSRQENLEEFLSSMQAFTDERRQEGRLEALSLTDFLQEVALYTDQDRLTDEDDAVSMMTVHGAKGLEFPTVFVVGLEENLFPSLMSLDSPKKIEEERRLLYVAITRAERHCFLTSAENRFRYGQMQMDAPSRFLRDIDQKLLNTTDIAAPVKRSMPWEKHSTYSDDWRSRSSRYQNSRPVATQFMADPKPKITATPKREVAVDPLSPSFKNMIADHGGKLVRVEEAIRNGGRLSDEQSSKIGQLRVGATMEHQRFGIGTVLGLEGKGENAKATIDFRNVGRKVLLLRFAKFTILQ